MTIQLTTAGVRVAPTSRNTVRTLIRQHGVPMPQGSIRATGPDNRVYRIDAPVSEVTPTSIRLGDTHLQVEVRHLFAPEYHAVAGVYPPELQVPSDGERHRVVTAHHGAAFADMLARSMDEMHRLAPPSAYTPGVAFCSPGDHVYLYETRNGCFLVFPLEATRVQAPTVRDLSSVHGADADLYTPLSVATGPTPADVQVFPLPGAMTAWMQTAPLCGAEATAQWAVVRRVYFACAVRPMRLLASGGLARFERLNFGGMEQEFKPIARLCGYGDLMFSFLPTVLDLYGANNEPVAPYYSSRSCYACLQIGQRHHQVFTCTTPRCEVDRLPTNVTAALIIRGGGLPQHNREVPRVARA